MESKILKCGEYLFKIGDLDDSIYVVQEGHINVSICESVSTLPVFQRENVSNMKSNLINLSTN